MIPIYVNNSGGSSLEELILKLVKKLSEFDKINIEEGYLKRIQEAKLGNFPLEKLVPSIKSNFSKLLIEICDNSEGIFFIIDDINGLSDNLEFTNGYKSLFESIQFNQYHVPVVFALISYPKEFENLSLLNESFSRIFKLIEIDKLENDEIEDFFKSSFEKMGYKFKNDNALNAMTYYSWGMPLIMQQIGESVLWNILDEEYIDEEIAISGISNAAIELANKQIKGKLNKIRSEHYEDILIKLANHGAMEFKKSEVLDFLDNGEKGFQ